MPSDTRAASSSSRNSQIARSIDQQNSDHHLWRNGRLWWIAFTVHRGWTKERVRQSLQTRDLCEARARRDQVFAAIANGSDCVLSLRLPRRT
jgi:hypothetical protein